MSQPKTYILFPGNARKALGFYQDVFGGQLTVFTKEQFGRIGEQVRDCYGVRWLLGFEADAPAAVEPG